MKEACLTGWWKWGTRMRLLRKSSAYFLARLERAWVEKAELWPTFPRILNVKWSLELENHFNTSQPVICIQLVFYRALNIFAIFVVIFLCWCQCKYMLHFLVFVTYSWLAPCFIAFLPPACSSWGHLIFYLFFLFIFHWFVFHNI